MIAKAFGISRQTVTKQVKRANHRGCESFKDRPRNRAAPRVTQEVEGFILFLRIIFEWGTARIYRGIGTTPKLLYV